MEWVEITLGSGFIGTLGALIFREGRHRQLFNHMVKRVEELECKVESAEERLHSQDVIQATILTELKYIRVKIDEIAAKADK